MPSYGVGIRHIDLPERIWLDAGLRWQNHTQDKFLPVYICYTEYI